MNQSYILCQIRYKLTGGDIDRRGTYYGVYSAGPMLGPVLGPIIGGVIVSVLMSIAAKNIGVRLMYLPPFRRRTL
jgi:MFS family permease